MAVLIKPLVLINIERVDSIDGNAISERVEDDGRFCEADWQPKTSCAFPVVDFSVV